MTAALLLLCRPLLSVPATRLLCHPTLRTPLGPLRMNLYRLQLPSSLHLFQAARVQATKFHPLRQPPAFPCITLTPTALPRRLVTALIHPTSTRRTGSHALTHQTTTARSLVLRPRSPRSLVIPLSFLSLSLTTPSTTAIPSTTDTPVANLSLSCTPPRHDRLLRAGRGSRVPLFVRGRVVTVTATRGGGSACGKAPRISYWMVLYEQG